LYLFCPAVYISISEIQNLTPNGLGFYNFYWERYIYAWDGGAMEKITNREGKWANSAHP